MSYWLEKETTKKWQQIFQDYQIRIFKPAQES